MGVLTRIYGSTCRTYSRMFVRDNPADGLYRFLCSLHFYNRHGYWPNFLTPRSFSEKVWHKMLFDRSPVLSVVADKLAVREYVRERVGQEYLISLLWSGTDPSVIPFESLPTSFVVKLTHGSSFNVIVPDKSTIDTRKVQKKLQKWLRINYCHDFSLGMEWCYRNIKPGIVVEKFVGEEGKVPPDYKFFCFGGRVEYLHVDFGRFVNHTRAICDRDFHRLDVRLGYPAYGGPVTKPPNYEEMLAVAEALSKDLDFIRCDLYSIKGRTYFGELTNYPDEGACRFYPRDYDFIFGSKWPQNRAASTSR